MIEKKMKKQRNKEKTQTKNKGTKTDLERSCRTLYTDADIIIKIYYSSS